MTAVKSNLQKLESLVKSATNARQRKMYQSLLDKARQDLQSRSATATANSNVIVHSPPSEKASENWDKGRSPCPLINCQQEMVVEKDLVEH